MTHFKEILPALIIDHYVAVKTDALGIVVKTAVMGKADASEGDTLSDPTTRIEYGFAEFSSDSNIGVLGVPDVLIKPSWIKTFSREEHGNNNNRWLEQLEYNDGLGRIALVKTKAEPRDNSPCWTGTGRTVFNNKGDPVKQYEPYFSNSDKWESEPAIRETGVTPIMYYDPLSRLIRTDFPDGSHSKVEFTAWEQKDYDRNDTAEGCPHFDTPAITHLDSLGRSFYVVANDGTNNN